MWTNGKHTYGGLMLCCMLVCWIYVFLLVIITFYNSGLHFINHRMKEIFRYQSRIIKIILKPEKNVMLAFLISGTLITSNVARNEMQICN